MELPSQSSDLPTEVFDHFWIGMGLPLSVFSGTGGGVTYFCPMYGVFYNKNEKIINDLSQLIKSIWYLFVIINLGSIYECIPRFDIGC